MSASSLCVTSVCDLNLPICVLYPMLFRVCMMSCASCRRHVFMGVVDDAELIYGVLAYGIDAEGAINKD